ncbi:Hypothetical predicted protein [Lynx pardinus]|uniref:Uncharacterized protein n=1 Tax=Lynx pardinus TaxID=191816 RepID=A0A485PFK3_LYNPA|nr:Hypothetical predicted protein [Lynx pardinus]
MPREAGRFELGVTRKISERTFQIWGAKAKTHRILPYPSALHLMAGILGILFSSDCWDSCYHHMNSSPGHITIPPSGVVLRNLGLDT